MVQKQLKMRSLFLLRSSSNFSARLEVDAGATLSEVCSFLSTRGYALENTASLPQFGVAGALATGTHGSSGVGQDGRATTRSLVDSRASGWEKGDVFSPVSREAPVISGVSRCPTSETFHSYLGTRDHLSSSSRRVGPFFDMAHRSTQPLK